MTKYDAFGRRLEEPPRPTAPLGRTRPRASGRVGQAVGVVLPVLLVCAAFAALVALRPADTPRPADRAPALVPPAPSEVQAAAPSLGEPVPPGSLFRRRNLARALDTVRRSTHGTPVELALYRDHLSMQLKTRDGTTRDVSLYAGGTVSAHVAQHQTQLPPEPWRRLDPGAPQRLIREAGRRARRGPGDVQLLKWTGTMRQWMLSFDGGPTFFADGRGRIERRLDHG